jgi:CheY-like chemotaxis protein
MPMAGEILLIIDAHPASLTPVRASLEKKQYEVHVASSRAEALAWLRDHHPALILLDLQAPAIDGPALSRHLKADPGARDIVVLGITDPAAKRDVEKAIGASCDGYITKPIDPTKLPLTVAAHLDRRARSSPDEGTRPRRPTALLVEDNPTARNSLRAILETAGIEVVEAVDGASALALANEPTPDVVLVDRVLPDIDGAELARRLRSRPNLTDTPFICLTGFLSHVGEDIEFAAVLEKPIDPVRLLDTMRWVLRPFMASGQPPGKGASLLIVDDDPLQRKLTEVLLVNAGFHVRACGDARLALDELHQLRPDAVVSDVLMPGMDGFELCLAIRRDRQLGDLPVVLTSSQYFEEADRKLAEKVGASRWVTRTPNHDDLIEAILAAIGATPPSLTEVSLEPVLAEHARRAIWQLERQIKRKAELAHKCALMEAQLSILAGVADALTRKGALRDSLKSVLAACLDMAGISKGALFRVIGGRMTLEHHIGFRPTEAVAVEGFFGEQGSLRTAADDRKVLAIPSPAIAETESQTVMLRCGVTSALAMPILSGETLYGRIFLGGRALEMTEAEPIAFARVLAAQLGQALALAEAFERVAVSEENFRAVVSSMEDLVVTLDRDQRATGVYGLWAEDGRIRCEVVVGKPLEEALGDGANPSHAEANVRALAGESVVYEWVAGTERGPLYMQTAASPLRSPTGDVVGVVRVGRDLTRMKALQEQLILSDRMASVSLLAASVTHEINNPLAVAVANLQLAKDSLAKAEGSPTELRGEIADASQALERVVGILRDLRVFCQPGNDQPSDVELVPVLEASLRMAVNEIRRRARVQRSYRPAPVVCASEARLGQVFLNLIVNAAQAMDEGRAHHNELGIATREGPGKRAIVEISDTGPGIPADAIPKLFSPFFTGKARGVGAGLGLAICHRIVTDMGGTIEVESQLGKGSLFRVILPGGGMTARSHPPPPLAAHASRRGQILVIDDDEMVATTLTRVLSPSHDVAALIDVREALGRIAEGARFDVILCDLMMPSMTGADFYRELARVAPEQLEKIIFMSGGAFTAAAQVFLDQTPNRWVQKPFDFHALLTLINGAIG